MLRVAVIAIAFAGALAVPATALAAADVAVTMTDSPDPVGEEDIVAYTITVVNNGPDPATGLQVTFPQLPTGIFSFQSATPSQGSLLNSNPAVWNIGTVAFGASANAVIRWRADHPGSGGTTVTLTSSSTDTNTSNNSPSQSTTVTGLSASDSGFADQVVGTAGPAKQIVVKNGAGLAVTFPQAPQFSGDVTDFFGVNGCAGATVAAGASCTITERFFPSALGTRSGTMTLGPTAGSVDPLALSLAGKGLAPPTVAGPPGPQGPTGPAGPPAFKLIVVPVNAKLRARAGKRVTFAYVSTVDATTTLDVLKGRKRVARVTGRARTGANKLRWNGKQGRKAAKAGNYTLRLTAVNGDQTATATAKLKLTRR